MAAIEYGSYYWCVILKEKESGYPSETVYLHADQIAVDQTGALTFISRGRRPAGATPDQAQQLPNPDDANEGKAQAASGEHAGMVYFAFAPGTWKIAYAAKLQDGSPASVEHWTSSTGTPAAVIPQNAGASDYSLVK
jgi:hypothetical protein